MSISELRYEWCSDISDSSRTLLRAELRRRKVNYDEWIKLGRGSKRVAKP